MNDKRRLPRKRPDIALQVRDAMTGEVVGRLGNLSTEGMMLIAHAPMLAAGLYQFVFHLPDSHGRLHPVEVGVHELWSDASSVHGQSWIGFRFIDVGASEDTLLREWLMQAQDFRG
jgi:hypothetical protein